MRLIKTKLIQLIHYIRDIIEKKLKVKSQPVFIVGCGHSGTSLLLAILGSHTKFYAIPFESNIAMGNKRRKFINSLRKFDKLTAKKNKYRWIEKTPKHILHIGKILNWCPDAKILLMVRDGRDVASSIKARSGSAKEGITRWVNDNTAGKKYWNHPQLHIIKYENLVNNFEYSIQKILYFLDEQYEPEMKDYHLTPKKWYSEKITKPITPFGENHEQYRNWQINQPLFNGSGKWKELPREDLSFIDTIAGELLSELGYIKNDT